MKMSDTKNNVAEKIDESSAQTVNIAEVSGNQTDADELNKSSFMGRVFLKIKAFRQRNKLLTNRVVTLLLNIVVVGYFAWATYHFLKSKSLYEELNLKQTSDNETGVETCGVKYCGIQWCDGYGMLIILLVLVYSGLLYYLLQRLCGKQIMICLLPLQTGISHIFRFRLSKIGLIGLGLAAVALFLAFDTVDSRGRLQSLIGIGVLFSIGFVFSAKRIKIKWRPVICGFTCQFLLGIFCMRWEVGRNIFKCIGDKVSTFLTYASDGSTFVYGELLIKEQGVFAFASISRESAVLSMK